MATYGEKHKYASAMDPIWANAYLGATTSIEPGKAMKDLVNLPASGIENVEISVIDPSKFEAIPREMFAEARRLGKMLIRDFTKDGKSSPISLHSPLIEPTGFAENKWDEGAWKSAQQQLAGVVEKAALLGPSVPLTIHGSHVPSMQTRFDPQRANKILQEMYAHAKHLPGQEQAFLDHNKQAIDMLKRSEIPEMMTVVDPTTGQLMPLQTREQVYPSGEKRTLLPFEQLEMASHSQWDDMANKLKVYWKEMEEAQMNMQRPGIAGTPKEREWANYAQAYANELDREALSIFQRINKTAPEAAQRMQEALKEVPKDEQLQRLAFALKDMPAPPGRLFVPTEEFAIPKAAETFANVAMRSYDIASKPSEELRAAGVTDVSKAPIITIENVYPEAAFGRGESMKALVDASRNKFAERLMQEKHLPQAKANEIAKNLIGATWDVGHINLLRKYGYNEEKITAEIKKIAEDIKHVHLTDNFGYYDAHLAPGMGNVKIKDMLEHIKKGGKIPPEIRGIVEAGGYVMSFGENPTLKTLQYFNAPVYGFQNAPSWGGENPAAGNYFMGSGGYSAGYGMILPPIHYGDYGAGFSGLPAALGAVPGVASKSAFAGTPNA